MRFIETMLPGAYLIEIELLTDVRGHFARAWCQDEFKLHGLESSFVQCNISYNEKRELSEGYIIRFRPSKKSK